MTVKITQLNKKEFKGFDYSQLVLQVSNVKLSIINGIRRICLRDIPIYAWEPATINIEHNDTIFNNDMMRLRISNLPIFNIKNDVLFLSQKFWKNIDFTDSKRPKHPNEQKIEMYISEHNDTLSDKDIYSDTIKLFIDGKKIDEPFKNIEKILIIRLRPNQTFKAHCRAVLAIGELNDIYSGASNIFFKTIKDNEHKLTIESQGQMDEYELVSKACDIAVKKLQDVKENIKKNYTNVKDNKEHIEIVLKNEDHTMGNIITEGLQEQKNVVFSGLAKIDLLIKEVKIKYLTKDKNPLDSIYKSIDNKIIEIKDFQKELVKIGKKYINY